MVGGNWEESVLRRWSFDTCSGSAAFGFTERSKNFGRHTFKPKNHKKKLKNESGWMRERENGALDGGNGA